MRVRPNDVHGGVFGPGGGVFLSIQHWLNGVEPHCVARDYTGITMGRDHQSKVLFGKAKSPNGDLKVSDAAKYESET